MRDYEEWHRAYDDPNSSLSWRLRVVSDLIADALDRHPGPIRVLSSCAGDGRDLLGVLANRDDAERVSAVLVELHPAIAERARQAAVESRATVEVRTADAGLSDSYLGAVPAEIVLMVGIFGNINSVDLAHTVATIPQFCAPGATVLWSRGLGADETNDGVRAQFRDHGFAELDYLVNDERDGRPAVGAVRYDGPAQQLVPGQRLFTFLR